jgi:hypothetical protein
VTCYGESKQLEASIVEHGGSDENRNVGKLAVLEQECSD